MSMLPKLIGLYRAAGHEPLTGYNPHHFEGYMDAPFTRFLAGNTIVGIAGLALQEVMFLEHFASYLAPRNILVIGNAHGWSTIALSLIFPDAKVLAIDPENSGNSLTNAIARDAGLRVIAADGRSPDDVARLCAEHLDGAVDLVLIDAVHTNEAVLVDFSAVRPLCHDGTVWVFHDVINWRLVDAINRIKAEQDLRGHVLTRTPSGMAVLWKTASHEFVDYVAAFTEDPNLFRAVRQHVLDHLMLSCASAIGKL